MAQEQLFLIEILVDKIRFSPAFEELPNQNDINVTATFGKFATLEIVSGDLARTYKSAVDPVLREISLNAGRSYLFPSKPDVLLKGLKEVPLQLNVVKPSDSSLIGNTSIPWAAQFEDMVNNFMLDSNEVAPAMMEGTFDMENTDLEESSGTINLFMRLSCFGSSIQTQFQVVERKGIQGETFSKKYLFKSSNVNAMFQAQKVVQGDPTSEVLPIAPLYNVSDPTTWTGPLKAENMTTDKLNKLLCKNPDCPGAKQFKEYGIGPAATGLGLGTVYGPTEIPLCYGLSHTYGTLDHYGPYGVFTRPKCLEEPFVGSPVREINTPGCECCQVEDGKADHEVGCQCEPLRLNGGGPIEDDNCNPCKPMSMCKDLMQSFDKVLSAYKKALGPCAQVSCSAPNNAPPNGCRMHCVPGASYEPPPENSNNVSACGTPGCPFSRPPNGRADRSFDQSQSKNACGMPTCPYTKSKIGSATDEEVAEMQALQRSSNARSGSKCPMNFMPPLPPLEPIHWDCPEPLPKGACRNPQCPLKPPECRYTPPLRGPCGNVRCPYAAPVSCGDQCAFSPPQPCPYSPPGCPGSPPPCYSPPQCPLPPPPSSCGSPSCPYAPPPCPAPSSCGSPTCPFSPPPCPPPTKVPCGNPECPFAPPSDCRPQAKKISCSNPSCPFSSESDQQSACYVPPTELAGGCDNPVCPFAPKSDTCPNPQCPYVPKKPSPCYISPTSQDICVDPNCPLQLKTPPSCCPPVAQMSCPFDDCPFNPDYQAMPEMCENPQCPYAGGDEEICDNRECPFGSKSIPEEDSICSIPNCPYAKKEREKRRVSLGARDQQRRSTMGQGELEIASGDRDPNANWSPCVPGTCKAEGGTITCDECEGPGEGESPRKVSKSAPSIGAVVSKPVDRASTSEKTLKRKSKGRKNNKKSPQLSYKVGDLYPGVNIGHKECIIPGRNVPAKMGWLWNVHVPCVGLKPRMGWCPGAVQRTVARRIIAYRKKKGLKLREPLACKNPSKKSLRTRTNYESDSDETVSPKPTLSIKKKDGTFFITMNPLKDPFSIDDNENPYMDCTPMQFKITKNKETKGSASQVCFCENEEPEESSDSELDIEFTPPAGIIRPDRLRKKKNVVHTDTQYDKADFTPKAAKPAKGAAAGKGGKKGKK